MKLKSLILSTLISSALCAQKVDLDKFSVTYNYRQLPTAAVDTNYKTYSIEAPADADIGYARVPLNSALDINIEGLKKLPSGGHYVVKISFVDARIDNNGNEEKKNTEKNKEGVVTKEWSTYKPYIDYSVSFKTELYDYKGTKLSTPSTHNVSKKRHYPTTNEYSSSYESSKYYNNNYQSIFRKLIGDEFTTHVKNSESALNSQIGFRIVTDQGYLWINDSKKHPEYDKQQAIIGEFKTWSSQLGGNRALTDDEVKKATEFLDYFEGLKKKYATDDKADKKLRYSAFYNKGIIYLYFLDNPAKAYDEGAGLIANEYDERDGKWLQTQSDNLRASLDKSKKKSRHFAIDLSNVKGPNE